MTDVQASSVFRAQLIELADEETELRHQAEKLATRKTRVLQSLQDAEAAERAAGAGAARPFG